MAELTEEWVEERLGGYVRMSIPERREAVAELTSEGLSNRGAADVLGVAPATVDRDVAASNEAPKAPVEEAPASNEAANPTAKQQRKAEAAKETKLKREASRSAPKLADAFELRYGDAGVG